MRGYNQDGLGRSQKGRRDILESRRAAREVPVNINLRSERAKRNTADNSNSVITDSEVMLAELNSQGPATWHVMGRFGLASSECDEMKENESYNEVWKGAKRRRELHFLNRS